MIEFVKTTTSTQTDIIEFLKKGVIKPPFALVANDQTSGIGSRGNAWSGGSGNLYFSFCFDTTPKDLPSQSASIYFAYILKEFLAKNGSEVWLKWPNDFYIRDLKIGGVITTKIKETYICGIGINLAKCPAGAGILDISLSSEAIVRGFCELLEKRFSWKQIFSKFLVEFEMSKKFISHSGGVEIDLSSATLCEDGSILINNKKVYSLR